MRTWTIITAFALTLGACGTALADEPVAHDSSIGHMLTCPACLATRETLTGNWFGLGDQLADQGVYLAFSVTQVYQINARGGISTHRHAGRYEGSYDLEGEFDLEKLLHLPGAVVYAHAEGSWSDGLDESSIGSVGGMEVNADAAGCRPIDLTELWYQQNLFNDMLALRIGKLDMTGGFECRGCPVSFDGNTYANDETGQFLNSALVNNPTIPFPEPGLGVIAHVQPLEWCYFSAGVADAQADARETGFNTTFHDEDYFFAAFETGVAPQIDSPNGPLQGAYRVGLWYDPQDKGKFKGGSKRDDLGFYLSLDQAVTRENSEDDQGLGLFARYGFAHSDVNEIRCFYSFGGQYQGLIPTRDDDVLGVGFAASNLAPAAGFEDQCSSVLEVYYNAAVTPWLTVSPDFQYVWNPGAVDASGNAAVFGVRAQLAF